MADALPNPPLENSVEMPPFPDHEVNDNVNIPFVQPVGLENLLRELDEAMDETYRQGRLSPDLSSCTSFGTQDVRVYCYDL